MTLCISVTNFSIRTLFFVSVLSCVYLTTITWADLVDQPTIVERSESTNETNQTIIAEEYKGPSDEDVLPDTKSESRPLDVLPTVDNQETAPENISETTKDPVLTTVDNQTLSSTSEDPTPTATAASTKKNLSSINSFEEWKQQQLLADLSRKRGTSSDTEGTLSEAALTNALKGVVSGVNTASINSNGANSGKKGKLRKNFASASCGAKILAHNPESQHTGSILSSSPDEYMLNPCNAKIWFVIELCESIRILNIEMANFELFSSVPKTFRVSATDRYPTKDWHRHHLGTFNASFNRTIQSFQTTESTNYLKYVKFELLDFHGHEHYCPLSVVRIHGSNVEDEIMTMEDNTNLNDLKSSENIPDENDNEDEDNNDLASDQQVGGIIGSAILDLAKRVFRRQTIRGTPSTTATPNTEPNALKDNCHQSSRDDAMVNSSLKSWRQSGTFKRCIARFLRGLWSREDTCIGYLSHICFQSNYCCQCPSNMKSTRARATLNFYLYPCGYYHVLTNQFVCKKEKSIRVNETISSPATLINGEVLHDLTEKNLTINQTGTTVINESNATTVTNQSLPTVTETLPNVTHIELKANQSNESSSSPLTNTSREVKPTILEPVHSSNTSEQSASQTPPTESIKHELNNTELSSDTDITNEGVTNTASPPSLTTHEIFPPTISSPWLKGMLVNTKSLPELFKIIEKLNFNLTLSNRYLQELSQHYVKKLDETQQTTDLLLKASKAADAQLKRYEEHLIKLQANFDDISYRLLKLEAWIPLMICILLCLCIWCFWSACRLARLRRKFQSFTEHVKEKAVESSTDELGEEPEPIRCNGTTKRKLSTDSSDSNLSHSQWVPDLTQAKIKQNGFHHDSKPVQRKSSH